MFRYRVRGFAAADAETAGVISADLALDLVRPLLAVAADASGDPVDTASLLEVDDRRIRLIGVTRTARGTLLARLQSLAETEIDVRIAVGGAVAEAWHASVIGVRRGPVDVVDGRQVSASGAAVRDRGRRAEARLTANGVRRLRPRRAPFRARRRRAVG